MGVTAVAFGANNQAILSGWGPWLERGFSMSVLQCEQLVMTEGSRLRGGVRHVEDIRCVVFASPRGGSQCAKLPAAASSRAGEHPLRLGRCAAGRSGLRGGRATAAAGMLSADGYPSGQ